MRAGPGLALENGEDVACGSGESSVDAWVDESPKRAVIGPDEGRLHGPVCPRGEP
jgi:hypothetical protein